MMSAGDGAPFAKSTRLKDGDKTKRWGNITPWPGLFHFFMEDFKMVNKLFVEQVKFLLEVFKGVGDNDATEKNMSHFVSFNDPTDCSFPESATIPCWWTW